MGKIKVELTDNVPNLTAIGIDPIVLERYGIVEARSSVGRRIAAPYLDDCVKLLGFDGSYVWDGGYTPEAGLFGQRQALCKTLILCAHEFEALKVQSDIVKMKLDGEYAAVAVPTKETLDQLSLSILLDSLRVVCTTLLVWHGTGFSSQVGALEAVSMAADSSTSIKVQSLGLSREQRVLELKPEETVRVIKGAKGPWYPGNLARAEDIFKSADFFRSFTGVKTGYDQIDFMLKGMRLAELMMFTAGTGIGKSTLVRLIAYNLAYKEDKKVGLGFLEETKEETLKAMACIHYGLPSTTLRENPNALSDADWKKFLRLPGTQNLYFINSSSDGGFGGMDVDELLNTVRYLKHRHEVEFFVVDHLSIMVSGKVSSKEGERKDIDIMMTKLAMACVLLRVCILGVCHLSQPDGKPHEEGGRVLVQHLRGSGSLKQLSWTIIALERNQQSEDSSLVLVRILKNRNGGGVTGPCVVLQWQDPLYLERKDINIKEFLDKLSKNGYSGKRSNFGTGGPSNIGGDLFGGSGKRVSLASKEDNGL